MIMNPLLNGEKFEFLLIFNMKKFLKSYDYVLTLDSKQINAWISYGNVLLK